MYLYGKLDTGTRICVIHEHQPYFYALVDDIDTTELKTRLQDLTIDTRGEPAQVTKTEPIEKELLGKKKQFWKVYTNYPKAVPLISKELETWGVETYEKDILFIHRYLRDMNITPMTLVEAEGEQVTDTTLRVPAFQATEIKQSTQEPTKNIKYLAIDIETYTKNKIINPNKDPILMIAFYGQDQDGNEYKKVITWKTFNHSQNYIEHVSDEEQLLQRFRQIILDYQPDIITGYFSDGFDLPYIKVRADKHKVKLNLSHDRSELYTGSKNYAKNGESKLRGILHIDIFKFIRYIFGGNLKTESFSLDAVSSELLGNQKHEVDINDLTDFWDNDPDKLEEFCKYNLQDSYLTLQLCKTLMPDMLEFTKIIGLPLFDIIHMRFSRLVENYIIKRATEYNVIAPNKPKKFEIEKRSEETYQGGFVYEPTPGLYNDIVVMDFRSLYPTIITAHNIGPESLYCKCCKDDYGTTEDNLDKDGLNLSAHVPDRDEYWFCKKEKKFIPEVLERLVLRRVDIKRLIKEMRDKGEDTKIMEARSYALKILANSFYGYLGFFGARWYCIECARSTTAYARHYIQRTIKKAEEKGFQVVYGDTDSLFFLLGDKPLDKALEFKSEINYDLPGYMELEFEGYFPKGLFVAIKGSEKGAKKKYALIDKDKKLKITGFETVRRNWSIMAKDLQENVLRLVLQDKVTEAVEYVQSVIEDLNKGKIKPNKLIMKTQITKDLSSYSNVGPHVAVALRMKDQGIEVVPGTVVEYIIAKGSGLIRERARLPGEIKPGQYDNDYYLKHQLIPAVSSIFAVLKIKEEDLFKAGGQTSLGSFS